jgi:pre-mRNA-splicing factor SYF1
MPAIEIESFLEEEQDFEFEEAIVKNPYSLKLWWRYIEVKKSATSKVRNVLHERACKLLPRSYKLWKHYLDERKLQVLDKCITDPQWEMLNNTYERALVHLHKMPRIWLDYCELLMKQKKGTFLRRTFDRALQSLPITQHKKIWKLYLKFARELGVWQTAVRIYRRNLKFDPTNREEYIEYLQSIGKFQEVSQQLALIVNDETFKSQAGKNKHQLWMELCEVISSHPDEVAAGLNVERIIRAGLRRFTDEVGKLWCTLADYFIRLGQFERARDIYEEAIDTVVTVRDFSMVFDAFSQFEESMLTAKMEAQEEEDDDGEADELDVDGDDIDMRLARLEHLMERRPVLLSSVLLRQNPHNVHEWAKRVKLFEDPQRKIVTYTEAVKTIEPEKAVGHLHMLWIEFAKFYESHEHFENARVVYEKATKIPYQHMDELAKVWTEWAEFELRHEEYDRALATLKGCVQPPVKEWSRPAREEKQAKKETAPVQERIYKSTVVWALYLDLEESLGDLDSTRAAYEKALELKVSTPQMILNYAAFLEENKYFEESFRVYEKGVSLFTFPHVLDIWKKYLTNFVKRYAGTKLERSRDLFEQCLETAPAEVASEFYLLYAKLEEEHGLLRHAMGIYDRACEKVADDKRFSMYQLYARKAEEFYGVTKTREIFEKAIENLNDSEAKDMCVAYSKMEKKLGEIDRARALLVHGSQFCDPHIVLTFWKYWHDFEVAHGNEETFREMLRVKRSVSARYSQTNYMAAEMLTENAAEVQTDAQALIAQHHAPTLPVTGNKRKADEGGALETDMEALERQAAQIVQATQGAAMQEAEAASKTQQQALAVQNPDEISIDDLDDDLELDEKAVPDAVFGKAKDENLGALARFKNKGQ